MKGLMAFLVAVLALAVHAQIRTKNYAQQLVDEVTASNPELLVIAMHVTPPDGPQNLIIASNIGRLGKAGDDDDLVVIRSGQPQVKVSRDGQRYGIEVVMQDVVGNTVGALGLVWRYGHGQDAATLTGKSLLIRDALARRTLNIANLFDPFPFEPDATVKTRAQKLIDQAVAADPRIAVLALRAPGRPGGELVVLGSTFGRHGKKADADDLKIFHATDPVTGIYAGGKRFGVDLPLKDRAGATIGTMNVGYALRGGDDTQPLLAHALQLREALQRQITSSEALGELDP